MSNESGRFEVYVRPFVDPAAAPGVSRVDGREQISSEGGWFPRWRHDGKEIYYLTAGGDMMAASVALKGATLEAGTPVRLFQQRVSIDDSIDFAYDVTADGRFLVNTIIDSSLAPITLVMNWNPRNVK